MLFHFYSQSVSPLHEHLSATLPAWLGELISYLYCGVEIFFVLSGFVIALSMDGNRHNLRYAGNFIVRRSLRLDPPFWTACILMLAYLVARWPDAWHGFYRMFGGVRGLLANMFYVQNLPYFYPAKSILDVSWTLCLEVQFYLGYLLVLILAFYGSRLAGRHADKLRQAIVVLIVLAVGLWSLSHWVQNHGVGFTGRAWMFFMGVAVYTGLSRGVRMPVIVIPLAAIVAWFLYAGDIDGLIAVGTALAIYGVGVTGRLSTAMAYRPLLYLGRTSYSLYLLHLVVGFAALSFTWEWLGEGTLSAWIAWTVGIATSLISADLLHRFVEAPSNRLSRRLKMREATPAPQPASAQSAVTQP